MRTDIYTGVTARIIAALEEGTVPWQRPWKIVGGFPVNVRNGRRYRGINVMLLMLEGYDDPRWGTFDAMRDSAAEEAKRNGRDIVVEQSKRGKQLWEIIDGERVWFRGGVRKGEHGTEIILWKKVDRKDPKEGEDKSYRLLRSYKVFNAKQCDGIPELPVEEVREFTPIEKAEQIVGGYIWTPGSGNTGPTASYGFNHASYNLRTDVIELPDPEQFYEDAGYYTTLFHELIHSTGSEKRLKRIEPALFGSDPYAREELVAEIGASFLAGIAEFDDAGGKQSAAYIANWMERIKNDSKLIVNAAAQAQKASDLILGVAFEDAPQGVEETLVAA